jgi:2-polyprenyl-6-methoxyphenol hydroxylase-like FAD-dependent oxidoreductase
LVIGGGINLLPHATRELAALGVLEELDLVAICTRELIYTNRFGQEIWREPRGVDAGYEHPQLWVRRGSLQRVFHDAARARLGPDRIHAGHRLARVTQDAHGVTARFTLRNASGSTSTAGPTHHPRSAAATVGDLRGLGDKARNWSSGRTSVR